MKFRALILLPLFLSACGQADGEGSTSATVTSDAAQVAGVAPAFLEGQWCYSHFTAGEEKSVEMINYIFSKDGTLLYQTNPSTEIDETGSYVIKGDEIKIKPALAAFNTQFERMAADQFVLKMAYGQMYWYRGACKSSET
ncbi:MAG: hypothetical protein V7676_07395 [Parasphingorhabdus sp.]|uniref:hypothetical protein n=1 Tax=Parasphingorhabdus sp. TaxID=2709688 RepID=UPI003001D019